MKTRKMKDATVVNTANKARVKSLVGVMESDDSAGAEIGTVEFVGEFHETD